MNNCLLLDWERPNSAWYMPDPFNWAKQVLGCNLGSQWREERAVVAGSAAEMALVEAADNSWIS